MTEASSEILKRFGIRSFEYRKPDKDYEGPVFVWDIDNTYLVTNLASWREMLKIPFESADEKVNVSGTAALLRALQRGAASPGRGAPSEEEVEEYEAAVRVPLYFISASPPQLRNVLLEKMHMDGFEPFGMIFKDNIGSIRRGRFSLIRNQLAFKLLALGLLRFEGFSKGTFYLFGDDTESDAFIYTLFSDLCSGGISREALDEILRKRRLKPDEAARVGETLFGFMENSPADGSRLVAGSYINLATGSDPEDFEKYGSRLRPVLDSFQMAMALNGDGLLDRAGILEVAAELSDGYNRKPHEFAASLLESRARGFPDDRLASRLVPELAALGYLPGELRISFPLFYRLASFFHRLRLRRRGVEVIPYGRKHVSAGMEPPPADAGR